MHVKIDTDQGTTYGDMIKEESIDPFGQTYIRKWRIVGKNQFQPNGWDIKDGSCTRLVFPIDLDHYFVN